MLELMTNQVQDIYSRDNFQRLLDEFKKSPFLNGTWIKKEILFVAAATDLDIPHGMGIQPSDILLTYFSPSTVTVTVRHDLSTATSVFVTTTGACTIRLLIGRIG